MSETILKTSLNFYRHPKFIALEKKVEEQAILINELRQQLSIDKIIDDIKLDVKTIDNRVDTILKDIEKTNKALNKSIETIDKKITTIKSKK